MTEVGEQRAQQRRREGDKTRGEEIGDELTGCSLAGEALHSNSDGGGRTHGSNRSEETGVVLEKEVVGGSGF